MEVRKDFAKRVSAIAQSTPREVISNLLRSMLPREPVKTRSPEAWTPTPAQRSLQEFRAERDPFAARMATRRRKVRNRSYEVIFTRNRARPGTKRHTQLQIVLDNTNTASAMRAGAESVDITFAESEGYIRFTS